MSTTVLAEALAHYASRLVEITTQTGADQADDIRHGPLAGDREMEHAQAAGTNGGQETCHNVANVDK